jgi:hypothetical protein
VACGPLEGRKRILTEEDKRGRYEEREKKKVKIKEENIILIKIEKV